MGASDPDGVNRTRSMHRAIERGQLAFCMAKVDNVDELRTLLFGLSRSEFEEISAQRARDCRIRIRAALAELEGEDQSRG